MTLGRRCRSEMLFVYGTSRLVTNTNRCARLADAFAQPAARLADRLGRDDPIEPALQIREVLLQRGVLQRLSPSADGNGAQQQPPERSTERGVATFDGELRIAQQMRQAHLPCHPVSALAAQHVGHPDRRPDLAEQRLHHGLAATGTDDVQHRQCGDEHPFPPVLADYPGGEPAPAKAGVSSEHTTLLAVTVSRIVSAAASNGSRARASILLIAPSLSDSEKISSISRANRCMPMAWA